MTMPLTGQTCRRCTTSGQIGLFCENCRLFLADETGTVERVTFTRRFFGDSLLEGVLVLLTLVIGWFIWFAFAASDAQSPAKKILNVYVIDTKTGKAVTAGSMWLRDVVLKFIVIDGIVPFGGLINGLFVLFDKSRQALHDKAVSTVVVYAPQGLPEAMRSTGAGVIQPGAMAVGTVPGASASSGEVANVAERLRELARLRDEGILTSEEYEQKRGELAGRL